MYLLYLKRVFLYETPRVHKCVSCKASTTEIELDGVKSHLHVKIEVISSLSVSWFPLLNTWVVVIRYLAFDVCTGSRWLLMYNVQDLFRILPTKWVMCCVCLFLFTYPLNEFYSSYSEFLIYLYSNFLELYLVIYIDVRHCTNACILFALYNECRCTFISSRSL